MAADGWSGFTEEDLRKIKQENDGEDGADKEDSRRKLSKKRSKKALKSITADMDGVGLITKEQMLSSHTHLTNGEASKSKVDSKMTVKLRLKSDGHSVEVVDGETRSHVKEKQAQKHDNNVSSSSHLDNHHEVNGDEVVASSSSNETTTNKRMTLEEFEWRQKMIEEQNVKRRALLTKALADRRKKTKAETEKLSYIQKELEKLNSLVSNDIAILRKHIEIASMEFSEVQKRYERAEKEFVDAKVELFRKMERKEQLTEHLCTIIEQNELRKAKKLAELMFELEMDNLVDETTVTNVEQPVLTQLCLMNDVNYFTSSTVRTPNTAEVTQKEPISPVETEKEQKLVVQTEDNEAEVKDVQRSD